MGSYCSTIELHPHGVASAILLLPGSRDQEGLTYASRRPAEREALQQAGISLVVLEVTIEQQEVSSSNLKGDLDWHYDGSLLFFKFNF